MRLLELGMTAHSELESRFLVNALRITAKYLGVRAKGGTLQPIGAGLAYMAADAELVLPLPVDYLSWSQDVRAFFDRARVSSHEQDRADRWRTPASARGAALTERGWNIVVRAPWPDAPAYATFDEPSDRDGLH